MKKQTLVITQSLKGNEFYCTLKGREALLQFLISAPSRDLSSDYYDYIIEGW